MEPPRFAWTSATVVPAAELEHSLEARRERTRAPQNDDCEEAEVLVRRARLRRVVVRRRLDQQGEFEDQADRLRRRSRTLQSEAETLQEQADDLAQQLGEDSALVRKLRREAQALLRRAEHDWNLSWDAHDRAHRAHQRARAAWFEMGRDLEKASRAFERCGRHRLAAETLEAAIAVFDPLSLRPWLTELSTEGPHLFEDGISLRRTAARLEELARLHRRAGDESAAEDAERRAEASRRAAKSMLLQAASWFDDHGMPELADWAREEAGP